MPCLVERLTDTTQVPDPRKAPKYSKVTVGDVSFFLIVEFGDVELTRFLPENVRSKYDTQGIYAYFDYVTVLENRKALQKEVRAWLKQRLERGATVQSSGQ